MKLINTLALTAAGLLSVAPLAAGAQVAAYMQPDNAAAAPIAVQHVSLFDGGWRRSPNNRDIDVTFENTASTPATRVVFEVVADGMPAGQLVETGTFSPNVAIHETTPEHDYLDSAQQTTLVPVEVDFADGQVWKAQS